MKYFYHRFINNIPKAGLFALLSYTQVFAADLPLTINIIVTELNDISGEEIKSADLAEALTNKLPSVSIIRRSGIANDIILRGQNRDNINITFDDAKIYGACPNRMDPPTSHVLTNNIESINIIEGPYDVQNFGTLSGGVKIKTKKPEKEFKGEVSANFGSWDYRKLATTLSGGNELFQALVSISKESGGQYQDGNGDDFNEQLSKKIPSTMVYYKNDHKNMDAYDKSTFMGKVFITPINNHQATISYTANRSDDILYPSSKMDALYDDSNMLNLDYAITNLGSYSNNLEFHYYDSDVEHPMSTKYRNSSGLSAVNERVSKLSARTQGLKIKNTFEINNRIDATIGFDTSNRNWDGSYIGYGTSSWITGRKSIDDVDTKNKAIFIELNNTYDQLTVKSGLRYDDTSITPSGTQTDNDYSSLNGFINGIYHLSNTTNLFLGAGKSSRVPDARELYFKMAGMNPNMPAPESGTPTLEEVKNYELDFGIENNYDNLTLKTKLFHSWLKDYIYFNAGKMKNSFENIDATLYGINISGLYTFTDELSLDFGLSYQIGQKDDALTGQTDKDLSNISPAKMILGLTYEYASNSSINAEAIGVDSWDNYDADNGEQHIDNYAILNLKLNHQLSKNINLTVGVDNVFDETYSISNTYKDLILLTDGSGDVMLVNEPGRYFYINGVYKF
ncbi:MAG: TonB-dependent receptor [Gammaproteobacteria bacterium]|nr:TonB-dependent receptor [Gammaproteobacteria bacterium]